MTSEPDPTAPVEDRRPRAPVLNRVWGALLAVFGLWLAIEIVMLITHGMSILDPAFKWIVGASLALLVTGFSLWMGLAAARVSAMALAALGAAGIVAATVNGAPLNGFVGFAVCGTLGAVSLLLARRA